MPIEVTRSTARCRTASCRAGLFPAGPALLRRRVASISGLRAGDERGLVQMGLVCLEDIRRHSLALALLKNLAFLPGGLRHRQVGCQPVAQNAA